MIVGTIIAETGSVHDGSFGPSESRSAYFERTGFNPQQ